MKKLTSIVIILILISSCENKKQEDEFSNENINTEYIDNEEYIEGENNRFEDGTYNATVEYNNPETDYSNSYELEVEIEDNNVTVIYFPNDGYLDEDHIDPTELDDEGYAYIEGENGKTYEIYVER